MLQAYEGMISTTNKARLNRLEMLDESLEEWSLIMSHYCVSVAAKGGGGGLYADVIN